ncbi:Holliday junction resolvase [Candidatus Woesearchaeota archaeon]|jgi:Holliday junction resolvase|nr:Holliday junction resolvase [Candidatus Woesearchaeota archaeon]MDP6647953.1 Holliday junction resolvase Hjc [Candidatus Woesearchaeota archaeon]|tara:strand:+ start:18268 stop:18657 length:390 start_codon:yes stop_codon:yes gene_type:complete
MSVKSKGSNAERELLHMFWSKKWACLRSAGSGSMKYPGPDLLVGNKSRRMSIECKSTKKNQIYLDNHDINQLKDFSKIFDAKPLFAVRFARKEWLFLNLEDIEKTPKGYVINLKTAELRGLSFEEIISY